MAFYSLFLFAAGVFFAAGTAICAYFANRNYAETEQAMPESFEYPYVHETDASKRYFKIAQRWNIAGVALVVAACIAFVIGIVLVGIGVVQLMP